MRRRMGVLIAVALLALTACGSADTPVDEPQPSGEPPVPTAAPADTGTKIKAALAGQRTYSFEVVVSSVDSAGKPVAGQLLQHGSVQLSPFAASLDTSNVQEGQPSGETSTTVFVDGKGYVRTGSSWAPLTEQDPTYATRVTQRDPGVLLELVAAVKNLQQLGTEPVGATDTMLYAGQFQPEQFADLPASPAVSGLTAVYGGKLIAVQVWADSAQLVRRLELTWATEAAGALPAMTTTQTVTFTDFNAPVTIAAPA